MKWAIRYFGRQLRRPETIDAKQLVRRNAESFSRSFTENCRFAESRVFRDPLRAAAKSRNIDCALMDGEATLSARLKWAGSLMAAGAMTWEAHWHRTWRPRRSVRCASAVQRTWQLALQPTAAVTPPQKSGRGAEEMFYELRRKGQIPLRYPVADQVWRRPGFRPGFLQVRAGLRPARDFFGSKAGRRQVRAISTCRHSSNLSATCFQL